VFVRSNNKKKTIQSLNLAQGAAHRDAREWKKGKSGNHLRGDNHCARTGQQNQNFRSRENKEENQKGHRQDPNKSFLLKFNKITLNSCRSPPSLPHLIIRI
jgi:hypothetical protein